jgi:CO/xanthine dehydrogenase Mo-binding subunit
VSLSLRLTPRLSSSASAHRSKGGGVGPRASKARAGHGKDRQPQQNNFDVFVVVRINEEPLSVRTHLVPARVGCAVKRCPANTALCNAIFAATGKRIRSLPIGAQLKV